MAKTTTGRKSATAAVKKTETAKEADVEIPTGRYIDLRTDFGFKHIFNTKEFLINFLNAVLRIKGGIVDLHYGNTVKQGRFANDRTAILDLYCTTKRGDSILIEMQNARQDFFRDRTLYYASRLIQEQGEDKKGKDGKEEVWDFKLSPVYSVNIVDFLLTGKKQSKEKYAWYVQLFDVDTGKLFHDRLTLAFFELPRFNKKEYELETDLDRWMYILKNLSKLNELPDALRTRFFEKLFLKAEIAKLSKQNRKNYDQSLKNYMNMYSVLAERDRKIAVLSKDVAVLSKDNAVLSKDVAVLSKTIVANQKRIAELERRLGLNGTTVKKSAPSTTKVGARNNARAGATANT